MFTATANGGDFQDISRERLARKIASYYAHDDYYSEIRVAPSITAFWLTRSEEVDLGKSRMCELSELVESHYWRIMDRMIESEDYWNELTGGVIL